MKSELKTLLAVMLMTIMCVVAATIGYMLPHTKVEVPKAVTDEISALKTSLAEAGERLKSADTNHAVAIRSLESELKSAKDYGDKMDAKVEKMNEQLKEADAVADRLVKAARDEAADAKVEAQKARTDLEYGTSGKVKQLEGQITAQTIEMAKVKRDYEYMQTQRNALADKIKELTALLDKAKVDAMKPKSSSFGPGKL